MSGRGTPFGRTWRAALALGAVVGLATLGSSSSPAAPGPPQLAERIASTHAGLLEAIETWHAEAGDPPNGQAPAEVIEPALALQEQVRRLARNAALAKSTIRLLPGESRRELSDLTAAARKLGRLAGGGKPRKVRVGKPEPLATLDAHYREAERRYGVGRHYLTAINLVETKFGRVKSKSVAGARGPMQFIPSTWKIYGRGGDIDDPHDAILAAANLLRDNGAPGDYGRALYAYNPSRLYVAAVRRYAGLIAREPTTIHYLYAWGP
ncbi:MAG TPA: transglycosylase SLT domain-containing protein [Solirubrobacterales bacterium]|jgi:membrane-bound lytic murein transglycosylase B|nr:transglycosylase SLT domain-containing protein [Solirubrobacterales bacterium]